MELTTTLAPRAIPAELRIDGGAEIAAMAEWLAAVVGGAGQPRAVIRISGGVDSGVVANVVKTEVWQLAEAAGVPRAIIEKAPSAALWPGQTDEGELGFTYTQADRVLAHCYPASAAPRPRGASARAEVPESIVAAVLARVDATAWKRAAKPVYPGRRAR